MKHTSNRPLPKKLMDHSVPFQIKEAFNALRTNIMYTAKESEGSPVYAVTSSEVGVGKSTISANLALSFAQAGKKVLLVDADMRRPTQHEFFGYEEDNRGLSELLSHVEKKDDAVVRLARPNLYLLTSGCIPPNPSELMCSQSFKDYIKKWRGEYDIVFIDLPPVSVVSDPLSLAALIDGYLFVAMLRKSNANHINAALANIESVQGRVIGTIVNGIQPKARGYRYKKYSHDYYYYSPYKEEKKSEG